MTRLARTLAVAAVVVAAVAAAACTRAGGGQTGGPSNQPEPSPAPTASYDRIALTPEQFWARLYSGDPEAVNYPALADMFKDSDAVVLGSFAAVTAGPDSVAGANSTNFMLTVTVTVDRVLHGSLPAGATSVPIAVFLGVGATGAADPYAALIANRAASMPHERGVFLLQNLVAYYSRFDPSASQRYDPTVYQVASVQGLIRDARGTAWVPDQTPGNWATALGGRPFETILTDLSAAADSQ